MAAPMIEIPTTQNVRIEYELASLRDRIFAFVIDFLLVMTCYYLLTLVLMDTLERTILGSNFNANFVFFFFPLFLFLFYQFFSELFGDGKSFGKRMMGIRVVRLDGREAGLSDYLLRAILLIVDVMLTFGVVAAILVGSTAKRQRTGDLTANTTVVRTRSQLQFQLADILKINSLENYQPQFPEVRRLKEKDMLLIKNALSRYQTYPNQAHHQLIEDLTEKLLALLQISNRPSDKIDFLKTLLKDYIVLTR